MRVIIGGEQSWKCFTLANEVIRRLVERYGADELVVISKATPGVDTAVLNACRIIHYVKMEIHPELTARAKRTIAERNADMVASGADLCIVIHRTLGRSRLTADLAIRAIAAGIPTWLVNSDECNPVRLRADDAKPSGLSGP